MSTATALASQRDVSAEMAALQARRGAGVAQPLLHFPPYRSSALRAPTKELVQVDPEGAELLAPVFGHGEVDPREADLTIGTGSGAPIGERLTVRGRILDGDGHPIRHQLVEIWQANAAGRYVHQRDQHPAPLDPSFTGTGRCLTDADGWYAFTTIKPGPYPWRNHHNAWRPAHIHFSLFGSEFTQRLITQLYFPGDPLFPYDPILQSITDERARARLVATYDHDLSEHERQLGYRWDVVLSGSHRTPLNTEGDRA
jgi:protocatechuate 3,4-dioxygenase beta subunit